MSSNSIFIIVSWLLVLLGCRLAFLVRFFGRFAAFRFIHYARIYYYFDYVDYVDYYVDYADYIYYFVDYADYTYYAQLDYFNNAVD